MPSGTMGNQIGMRLVCEPGQEVLCDADAHVVTYEMGAAAAIFGISTRTVVSDGGRLDAQQLIDQVRPKTDWHLTATAAIAVENSHNRGGGLVQPLDELRRLWDWSRGAGRRRPPRRRPHLERRRRLGRRRSPPTAGSPTPRRSASPRGWARRSARCSSPRPSGSRPPGCGASGSAAGCARPACSPRPGLYALDHHLPRLGEDHEHAQLLAKRLGVDPSSVETNMVVLDDVAAPVIAEAAKAQGVLVSQVSARRIRLVLHLDVDRAAVDRAADVLSELL